MSEQFQSVFVWLEALFWQIVGFPIRFFGLGLFGLDRILWERHPLAKKIPGEWQETLKEVKRYAAFFKAVPYRKSDNSPFDKEQQFLKLALAVANLHYFSPNLEAYRRTVKEIGSYLKHEYRTNKGVKGSKVWVDYLHAKATVESLFGHSEIAACENSQASLLSQERGENLQAITYEGCTMCCRIESLTASKKYLLSPKEEYLMNAIDTQLNNLSNQLDAFPLKEAEICTESQLSTVSFYISMMRCKAQMHNEKPNLHIIEQNIERAKKYQVLIDTSETETNTYDATIRLYEVLLSRYNKDPRDKITSLYQEFREAHKKSNIPYFCLMRIPDEVLRDLNAYADGDGIILDEFREQIKQQKTCEFSRNIAFVLLGAILIPFILVEVWFGYIVPSYSQPLPELISDNKNKQYILCICWALAAFLSSFSISRKIKLSKSNEEGLVSSLTLSRVDSISQFCIKLAIALFSFAALGLSK